MVSGTEIAGYAGAAVVGGAVAWKALGPVVKLLVDAAREVTGKGKEGDPLRSIVETTATTVNTMAYQQGDLARRIEHGQTEVTKGLGEMRMELKSHGERIEVLERLQGLRRAERERNGGGAR